jgi:short-subunit dehydrogenase
VSELRGSHVVVIGATGALGSRLAALLAERGAQLTLVGRDDVRLGEVAAALGDAVTSTLAVDLTRPDAAQQVAAAVGEGRLDGVVVATGVVAFGPLLELDDDVLDELLLVNLIAPIRLTRALAPRLGRGGFVVQLSAVVAERAVAGMAAYSATKAALTAFDVAAATELRRAGVRVLDVRPPHTETGLADRPVAGTAPRLPTGLDPDVVAARVVAAIEADERDLPSSAFS